MSRKFGLELEYSNGQINHDDLLSALRESVGEHDPNQRVSTRETFRAWTLKGDASCGHEITSPALDTTQENFDKLKGIVDSIRRRIRGRNIVRRSCGFHVHFDIGEFTNDQIKSLLKIFYTFEGALLKLQPPSRTGNNYCRTLFQNQNNPSWIDNFDPDQDDERGAYFVYDHFTGINFGRFNSRGTIEIRYGASTVRGVKVVNWIKLLLILIEVAKSSNITINRTDNITDLIAFVNAHQTGIEWLERHKRRVSRYMGNRIEELTGPRPNRRTNTGRQSDQFEIPRVGSSSRRARPATVNVRQISVNDDNDDELSEEIF